MTDPFDDHLSAWQEWASSPWGRIRFAVVAHTLARHLDDRPLRVLDVGGGDAGDVARLAGVLRPGGLLSLIAPNPAGRVLQALVRGGPVAARDALHTDTWATATFQHSGRTFDASQAEAGDRPVRPRALSPVRPVLAAGGTAVGPSPSRQAARRSS